MSYLQNRLTLNSFIIALVFHIIVIILLLSTEKPRAIESYKPTTASTLSTTQVRLVKSNSKSQLAEKKVVESSQIVSAAKTYLRAPQQIPKQSETKSENPIQQALNISDKTPKKTSLPATDNEYSPIEKPLQLQEANSYTNEQPKIQAISHEKIEDVVSAIQVDEDSKIKHPPVYPKLSKRMKEQGTVVLRVKISKLGSIEKVSIDKSSGFIRLDNAAIKAILKWRFYAATHNGKPVEQESIIPIEFQLL